MDITYESKIRRRWLLFMILSFSIGVISEIYRRIILGVPLENYGNFYTNISVEILTFVCGFLYLYILYYFAYTKRGTKFLLFNLILQVLMVIFTILAFLFLLTISFSVIKEVGFNKFMDSFWIVFEKKGFDLITGLIALVAGVITIYFIIYSYKLYKVNKKI